MNVVLVTIGALAPTNDTLASLTWRDPARPDACNAPFDDVPEAMDASRAEAAAKDVERQLAVELDMPVADEIERLAFLPETGFETVDRQSREGRLRAGLRRRPCRPKPERSQINSAELAPPLDRRQYR